MIKKSTIIISVLFLAIILFVISVVITSYQYTRGHLMSYKPDSISEERLLADDFGITLDDKIHVSEALFSYAHHNNGDRYAVRITGVNDIYSFMSTNVSLDGEITVDNNTVYINGTPIIPDSRILNYEGTEEYDGSSIEVRIWGGNGIRSNGPFRYTVKISFFFAGDDLIFIECGCGSGAPFGNNIYNGLLKDEYWKDYIFYPIRPLF